MAPDSLLQALREKGRIVIVGASLAGLRAAEQLREEGFAGSLTLIGDEPYEPYDRPPLSKQVLLGWTLPEDTGLGHRRAIDAQWRLGVAATGLDRDGKRVLLADGDEVEFDRLLIATGVRSRPWPHETEAALDGVCVLRTREDTAGLGRRLTRQPNQVLIIWACRGRTSRASGPWSTPWSPASARARTRPSSGARRSRPASTWGSTWPG
ncbi:FAD-dependent oxidoreductase [Saccharopolyspora phatthalungensis]|uniref:NAD(P)H-nitrite reductase large subunit n=1 Tax=Saccharopolyspora phatthalungensis TaxID=664693 RepID=A0A840QDY4_9PSEU|nr:FAD/NAD(P)-binding oxidoreductase [Saccharopolyspora phatthalungensis]MBB5158626.1 NAD(P)H-nitrite reductase large subunit [Saccharopolyspora phatthalungensis]